MKTGFYLLSLCFFYSIQGAGEPFRLGVEQIDAAFCKKIIHKDVATVAVITNQTGVDQKGVKTVDILIGNGIEVSAIFVPEHGLHGTIGAEKEVPLAVDKEKNIPVMSLYPYHTNEKSILSTVKAVDMLIFDIQDSGMRHYTYIATLLKSLNVAARANKPMVILDRPNPLGSRMEGPVTNTKTFSEIAAIPIPLRHGMTMGEIAHYCNTHVLKKPVSLHVITMKGYHRKRGLSGLLLHALSPNIKTIDACFGYSFLGLLGEVRPFDVGVGTNASFSRIGLPDDLAIDQLTWRRLACYLNKVHVHAKIISYFNERKQKPYTGLQLAIQDINRVPSFIIFMNILRLFKQQGVPLMFSRAFDTAIGTTKVRKYILGTGDKQHLACSINEKLMSFYQQAKPLFYYKPHPVLGLV